MVDAAPPPPKKPAGPMKFILIGCGLLTGIFILGLGTCGGVLYLAYKGTDTVADVGAEYLRTSSQVQAAFGAPVTVRRQMMGWKVNVNNDGGNAQISYHVRGANVSAPFEGVVWLVRSAGTWSVVGARVQGPDGYSIDLGKPPSQNRVNLDD